MKNFLMIALLAAPVVSMAATKHNSPKMLCEDVAIDVAGETSGDFYYVKRSTAELESKDGDSKYLVNLAVEGGGWEHYEVTFKDGVCNKANGTAVETN